MRPLLIPPPAALKDCVFDAAIASLPAIRYTLPASLQPRLMAVLSGSIWAEETDQPLLPGVLYVSGATRGKRTAIASPRTRLLVLSLRSASTGPLLGVSAAELMEQVLLLADVLPAAHRPALAALSETLQQPVSDEAKAQALFHLLGHLRTRSDAHPPALHLPAEKLHLPASELAKSCGLGLRQFERRFITTYGQPLRSFRQQLRCTQLIMQYVNGNGPAGRWADIAADAGYTDQAHMNRDLQRFTGHTPGQLAQAIESGAPEFWPYLTPKPVLRRFFGPQGF